VKRTDTLATELAVGPERTKMIRNGVAIGLATGTYGLSFGALSVAAGLSLAQTCVLSLLMFTGASQFAFVGVISGAGNPFAAAAAAALLGARNGLYGLHLSRLLALRGPRKVGAAHFVIDESAALSLAGRTEPLARLGFWAGGLGVFVCWNIATLIGALGAQLLSDPTVLGLDVVAPAAFIALLAPRMRTRMTWLAAGVAVVVALAAVPMTPAGVPVLLAAAAVSLLVFGAPPPEPEAEPGAESDLRAEPVGRAGRETV
jgi:predicted branched-subunit amino acid permease